MNVTINGYITFRCTSCNKLHTLESESFKFEEDASEEAEDDDYIRYLATIDTQCPACLAAVAVKVDVWEFPAAVVNYCYYAELGATDIQCEFNIEHYFDDQQMKEGDAEGEQSREHESSQEHDPYDEDDQHTPAPIEAYVDRYDDDD